MQIQLERSMAAAPIRVSMTFGEAVCLLEALRMIPINTGNCGFASVVKACELSTMLQQFINDPYFD